MIIGRYIEQRRKIEAQRKAPAVAVCLDEQTKVTHSPRNLVKDNGSLYFMNRYEEVKDRQGMLVRTIFSGKEFDALIEKYFQKPVQQEPAKKGWLW